MELKLLDKNFEMCGLIDDWESLIWNRKYYDCGNFKLQVNIRFMDQFQNAKYIYCTDEREIGVIEAFDYVDNAGIISLNFSGRFLESIIASRVINTTHKYSNKTTEAICRELITDLIIESETGRKIDNFILRDKDKEVELIFNSLDSYPWEQNSDGVWQSSNQGVSSSSSTMISNEFTLINKRTLTFDWTVSSGSANYDYLYYIIKNISTGTTIGGTSTKIGGTSYGSSYDSLVWNTITIVLDPGTYTIQFTYSKDSSIDKGLDTGYVRNVKLIGTELGNKRTMQVTGGNLLDEVYELCKDDEISVMVNYDFDTKQYVCEFFQGLDRTDNQKDNTWAIFSKNYENILNDEYNYDITQYCNYAYVAGEVDEEDVSKRTIVTVDRIIEGEERKELYVDARDLQSDEDTTEEEYEEMLIERGIEKLNSNNKVETSDFTIDSLSNLEYKKDFDLGDKIVYKNDKLGMIIENRIVAITESYENGTRTLDVTFGNDYNIKKIKEAIQ